MDIRNRRELKTAAARSLAESGCDYRRWMTLHIGVTLAVSLVLSVLHYLLEQQIGTTGGLSGVGLRTVLTTVQSVLQLAQVALPFWQFGWLVISMGLARGEEMSAGDLLTGFHRFGPVLRLLLLQGIVYFAIGTAGSYAAMILFMMTPFAKPFVEVYMEAGAGNWDTDSIYAALDGIMEEALVPLLLIYLVVFLLLAAPVFYRLRFSQYCLADDPAGKALNAMKKSLAMTKGNVKAIIGLDLSFWWFYALDLGVTVIAYLDLLMGLFGAALPGPPWVSYFGALVIHSVCQLALYRWRKPLVDVTYVKAYEALQGPAPAPKPVKFPWSDQ